jgi:hypothetical protein
MQICIFDWNKIFIFFLCSARCAVWKYEKGARGIISFSSVFDGSVGISSGKMHAVPASLKGQYVIRFTVTSPRTTAQVSLISLTSLKGLSHETKIGEWNS